MTQTLTDLLSDSSVWDNEFSESESIPVDEIRVSNGELIVGRNRYSTDQSARDRLYAKAGAPFGYLNKRSPEVQAAILSEHLREGAFGMTPKIVSRHGQVFTVYSGELVELHHREVLTAVADSLGENASGLSVSKIDHADGRLELALVSEATSLEIRQGDIVQGGLHISHSRYGNQATQIQAYIYRLVCTNGMMRRECVSGDGIVRTRKLPASHPRAKELLLDQIRRLTTRTWDALTPQLTELRATSERPADVTQLLKQWLQRARISTRISDRDDAEASRTVFDRLLTAWREEGSENTYFGAVNALTRVASHDPELSARQRRVLSVLGGLLAFSGVHICPRCFSVLSEGAHAQEGHPSQTTTPVYPQIQ